jgi:hypothetical protein
VIRYSDPIQPSPARPPPSSPSGLAAELSRLTLAPLRPRGRRRGPGTPAPERVRWAAPQTGRSAPLTLPSPPGQRGERIEKRAVKSDFGRHDPPIALRRRLGANGGRSPQEAGLSRRRRVGAFAGIALCALALTMAGCGKRNAPQPPADVPTTFPRPYPSE